jgi:hypothetical protein
MAKAAVATAEDAAAAAAALREEDTDDKDGARSRDSQAPQCLAIASVTPWSTSPPWLTAHRPARHQGVWW